MKQLLNKYSLLLISIVLFASCGQKHNVVAEIEGIGNDTLLISYIPMSKFDYYHGEKLQDTIYSVDGKFVYDLPVEEPVFITFFPKKGTFVNRYGDRYPIPKEINLLVRPEDKLSIKGKLKEYYLEYVIQGSEFNEDLSRVRSSYIERLSETLIIDMHIDSLIVNGKAEAKLMDSLFSKRSSLIQEAYNKKLEYANKNLDKDLTGLYVAQQLPNAFFPLYEKLSDGVKEGLLKTLLDGHYIKAKKNILWREAFQNIKEGLVAPDFTLKSIENKDVSLNSIKDKYIVLDFWGSWCGPCRSGMPKMKEYYNKYKGKFEIIGIAVNDKENKWRSAVKKLGLPWVNLINDEDLDKDVNMKYGIKAYPSKLILDKQHRILKKFEGESEEFYKLLDELLDQE